ncbi:MAG: Type II secretion system protein D [Pseudomonadales bacterium]|nr:Type II secretion system protein D [Pseudomonadales bacterium]
MKQTHANARFPAAVRRLSAVLLGALLALGALAADGKLVMNMRDADIRALIQWVADVTGKNLVVHKDVQGKVTVLSSEPLTSAEAYQVFLATLEVHGFAAIDADGTVKIVPQAMANASGPPLGGAGGGEVVVRVIKPRNVPVEQLAANLRPLVPETGMLAAYPGSNSLIVTATANNVRRIDEIVRTLDRASDLQFEAVALRHANAEEVAATLGKLVPGLAGEEGFRFVSLSVDTRTNSILLSGEPENRRRVRAIIDSLDREVAGGSTDVVYLQYVQAEEMLAILKGIAGALQEGTGEDARSRVSIEASKSTNALVINAPPDVLARLRSIVEQVDIRRAQVLVEALIVEITDDDARDLGVSWVWSAGEDFPSSGGNAAVDLPGTLGTGLVTDDDGNVSFQPGAGLSLGYFENGDLKAVIRALSSTTRANILSTPTIVALDNEEAELLVGQNVPFKTGESTGPASSTENPFTTIQRQDIGLNLLIKPQINRGDSITLDLKQSTESIAPSVDIASDIVTNKRLVRTKALIKDGQTLVIGGLLQDDASVSRSKVPLLGDIPLLGKLFSSTNRSRGKTNLMVFIHPTILKDDAQVEGITRQRYDFMRERQASAPRSRLTPEPEPVLPEFETIRPR